MQSIKIRSHALELIDKLKNITYIYRKENLVDLVALLKKHLISCINAGQVLKKHVHQEFNELFFGRNCNESLCCLEKKKLLINFSHLLNVSFRLIDIICNNKSLKQTSRNNLQKTIIYRVIQHRMTYFVVLGFQSVPEHQPMEILNAKYFFLVFEFTQCDMP